MVGWMVSANSVTFAGSVTRRAPDILHYNVRNNVAPTGSGAQTINGTYQMQYMEQGEKVREKLVLRVAGMETNAMVSLTAAIGPDPASVVSVAHLPTDKRGRLNMTFMTQSPAPARPSKIAPVPESLSPLTEVGAICFEDSNGQVVGNAGVQDSQKFQLIVRRNLIPADPGNTNNTAAGSINLVANERRATLTLLASGLSPNTEYMLALNGMAVGVATSDEKGNVRIRGWPTDAPPILQLRSLALHEFNGPVVLSTTLPR